MSIGMLPCMYNFSFIFDRTIMIRKTLNLIKKNALCFNNFFYIAYYSMNHCCS